ncbi:hypothetical protein J437_LFUL008679 [Ladona fulva]|uniref:DDE Tnp4 domain-containing protein n=1 Tax=Ladona fulva TaxID=123851 RepID=A0A8K0K7K0_LADFU|nr:hypothetical protein J437_LFUL008679 [Ladona fulva]
MSPSDFETLLLMIGGKISRKNTTLRQSILPSIRIISKQSISEIVPEVCQAIIASLKQYVKMPKTSNQWKKIAHNFLNRWNFPHCIGSVDGKHIHIIAPECSGSLYFNYKLLCRILDGGVFQHTSLYKQIQQRTLQLPDAEALPSREKLIPFLKIGISSLIAHNANYGYSAEQFKITFISLENLICFIWRKATVDNLQFVL